MMTSPDEAEPKPEYVSRTTQITVLPKDAAIYNETATKITIEDEASGEFVVIEQSRSDYGKISIIPEEWPAMREAIDRLIGECI